MDNQQKIKIDLVGNIGDKGGIGNYSTKLYHTLKQNTNSNIEINKVKPSLNFPILESTFQNFLETPYILYKSNADIIHFTSQEQVSGLFWIPEKHLKNTIVTVHDISPYLNNYSGPLSSIISRFYVYTLKKVGKIIAISEFTKNELKEHLNIPEQKIEVIYQGIDTDYFYPREDKKEILEKYNIQKPYVVYVGSEIKRKNIKGNLEKFKELQEEQPELTLVKIGKPGRNKYRKQTLKHMKELNLEKGKDVKFTGYVDEKDLPYLYSMAEANLLYSHYEGFGRTALEAEACGTPTYTHNKPPMNEYLPKDRWGEEKTTLGSISNIQNWPETAKKLNKAYLNLSKSL